MKKQNMKSFVREKDRLGSILHETEDPLDTLLRDIMFDYFIDRKQKGLPLLNQSEN